MDGLKDELRAMVVQVGSLPGDFDENADLYTELGMPSIKALELLAQLEDRYGVSIPDDDFVEATSLDALTRMIQRLKN